MLRILKISIPLLLIFFILSKNAAAQDEGPATYKLANISVKGNRTYDPNTIIGYTGLRTGMEISVPSDETRSAIKKLWNLGLFSNISLYIDKKFGNDIYLVIEIEELPRVETVDITGNDEFSEDDLKKYIFLVPGEVISEQKIKDTEYYLKKYYTSEGYSHVEVKVDKLISASNEARIRIKIDEGKKVTVRNIYFEGNNNVSVSALRSAMEHTAEKVWWKIWDNALYDKEKLEEDKRYIVNYYKSLGYKDAEITGFDMKLSEDKEDIDITIKVNEGKKYYVNKVDFSGNKIYPDSLLLERLDIQPGDVYDMQKFQQNLYSNEKETDISSLYYDNGYLGFNAEVEDDKVVGGNKIDITVRINEGNQFKLGRIEIEGNEKTKDKVLRRELYTYPGDYFNRGNIKRSLQQLNALNYFNPERLGQDITLENDSTVNITYLVQERSSDQFNASVGYSGYFGFTGALGLTFNNFDISEPFTGGAGQILNFQWMFGEGGNYRTFSIGFQEPWLMNTPTLFGVNIFDTRQSYFYDVRETGGIFNIGRRFRWPDDYFRGDWSVKFQRTNVIDGGDYYQTGVRTQFSLVQTLSRSTIFDPLFPLSGTRVLNLTELSGGPFLPGNITYIKNQFKAEAYTQVIRSFRLVLYSSFDFSFINPFGKDKYLPPTEYFYMGGNGLAYNTIALRGYDDRNIGPKNINGDPFGGKVALKLEADLRIPLAFEPMPVYATIFAEAGNLWPDISHLDPFDLRRSLGFGVRILLPAVGLVGFDFGYGFDRLIEDRQDPKLLFHFQFGRTF
ncbi:MAG: outer membrane protein assembly factor BamA [Ignavibacteria bacterium]|nr:outer membrane protein assembly factor BamA [Ignavibacteria bacterium]